MLQSLVTELASVLALWPWTRHWSPWYQVSLLVNGEIRRGVYLVQMSWEANEVMLSHLKLLVEGWVCTVAMFALFLMVLSFLIKHWDNYRFMCSCKEYRDLVYPWPSFLQWHLAKLIGYCNHDTNFDTIHWSCSDFPSFFCFKFYLFIYLWLCVGSSFLCEGFL